jgi:hypothetical protein
MRDSAFANNIPIAWPGIVAGYISGGDPFHVWTKAEWARFKNNKKLPIFVRDHPGTRADGFNDAVTAIRDLVELGLTKPCVIALDLEAAQDPSYVAAFGQMLRMCGFTVWTYGSASTLFANPALDGYWVADYKGIGPFMENHSGVRATQYADPGHGSGGQWDSSTVRWWQVRNAHWWI